MNILSVESPQVGQKCQAWDPGLSVFTLSLWVVKLAASIMKPCPGWQNPPAFPYCFFSPSQGELSQCSSGFQRPWWCPNENFSIQRQQLGEPELRYQQLLHHCSAELWGAPDCKYYIVKKRQKSAAGWMDVRVSGAHSII